MIYDNIPCSIVKSSYSIYDSNIPCSIYDINVNRSWSKFANDISCSVSDNKCKKTY